ncbi:branched-chain amino acid ABC transporter substrate-binding protein [Undibacterium sp. Jales W-56]|uniref:branched-chain amino acid ABC transporter substrate-binding protein n=1 Tax=Undibacterium sp. Jales W-56 TaxID=2897325 RepID=UPI0021D2302B|nr:branched-chain amino acid ABC transporter substrate-binding protein [Undibacterium sp. Jales W-56]MCU6434802.1 branched-chain amino acid ABC transporter substrate-binding protein [Undibacterium sp. Jales W-56]
MKVSSQKLISLAVVLLLSACSRQVEVKIGVVAPMTGNLAHNGKSIANGAQIAVDELNEDGMYIQGKRAHFSLIVEDDKANPEDGKAAAQRLVDAGVAAVYGHFNSGVTIPAAPIYAKAGIPQMSASTNPKYTRMGIASAFRIGADDIEQGTTLGRIAVDKLKAKTVFVIDDASLFGVGLAAEVLKVLESKKITPGKESVNPLTVDYPQLVKKIGESKSDVVIYGGDEPVGLGLLKAMRAAGIAAKFVTGDSMCDAAIIKAAAGNADHGYFCTVAGVPPSWLSGGAAFMQKYRAKFGEPGAMSPISYDGIHVYAQAMQRAGSIDPKVFVPEMKKTSFDGKIQGTIEFDAKGDLKDGTVVIYESVGGSLTEQTNIF